MLYCTPRGQYPWGSVTGRPGPLTSSPPWRSGRSGSHPLEATSSDPRPPPPLQSGHRTNGRATAITRGSGPFASPSSHFLEVSREPTGRGPPSQQHLPHPHTPKSPRLGRSSPSSSQSRKTETDAYFPSRASHIPPSLEEPLGQAGGLGRQGGKRRRWASEACQLSCCPPRKGPGHPRISSGV